MLDLTPIMYNAKAAVHLSSENQAKQFFYYIKEHYPDKVMNWPYGPQWDYGERQCYAPYFPSTSIGMRQSTSDWYRKNGYDIIEFEELIKVKELPIEQSDMSLNSMLGL